jgi:hypothetical protein
MIVCPNCRTSNEEHARFCQSCGRSLEPGPSPRVRPEGGTSGLAEIRPPKPPARWPAIVLVVGLIVFAGAYFGYQEFGPDPCRGKFASPHFGYCLTVPNGWQANPARIGTVSVDQFNPPSSSTVVLVSAVDLPSNAGLSEFASQVRQQDQQAQLTPGRPRSTVVGGLPAQQWDVTVPAATGSTSYMLREVVVVKGEVGWKIQMNDPAASFQQHLGSFAEMLRSWHFA